MKVYAKDSMDRFGDDFTELILSYLTLEDKMRLECVSKQWKRCVFEKQFVIEIGHSRKTTKNSINKAVEFKNLRLDLDNRLFEIVLKKCPNVMKINIEIEVKSEVLSLIGQYCPNIKSLKYKEFQRTRILSTVRPQTRRTECLRKRQRISEILSEY